MFFILRKLISRTKIHNYEPAQKKPSNFKINKKCIIIFTGPLRSYLKLIVCILGECNKAQILDLENDVKESHAH